MKETITLKLNEKALRKSNIGNWIAAPIIFFGAIWTAYRLLKTKNPEPEATSAMLLGISILVITIWVAKLAWSQMRSHNSQLRDGVVLYELTCDGITNHRGETLRWSNLKKIYFRGGFVRFSYMTLNRETAFNMKNIGINAAEFYEACEFIKAHAPKNITGKLKLEKIPRR